MSDILKIHEAYFLEIRKDTTLLEIQKDAFFLEIQKDDDISSRDSKRGVILDM